ncbi:glycoside hydrolase superfamily [Zopfochytrium polystomum]|nr:glycoside hydrolase superfamily [Zopfochytrium polystomum]
MDGHGGPDRDGNGGVGPGRQPMRWVVRSGNRLVEWPHDGVDVRKGDRHRQQSFAFVSYNVPNLHYLEDRNDDDDDGGTRRCPTPFEQMDAVAAIARHNHKVARIYALSIQSGPAAGRLSAPAYHVAADVSPFPRDEWLPVPGTADPVLYFNETLLRGLDEAVAAAHSCGVRLIIPFIDRWEWWGGIKAFASLHGGRPANDFYTHPPCINNFSAVVAALVSRRNTVSGLRYSEDPAILAWETGNELETVDCRAGTPAVLACDDVDAVTGHYYDDGGPGPDAPPATLTTRLAALANPLRALRSPYAARFARDLAAATAPPHGKLFLVGEFGLSDPRNLRGLLDAVVAAAGKGGGGGGVVGALLWSLRFRARDGGFYVHPEGDDAAFWSYHVDSASANANADSAGRWGFAKDEPAVVAMMKEYARRIDGRPSAAAAAGAADEPPPSPPPVVVFATASASSSSPSGSPPAAAAPTTTPAVALRWRGSAGATAYRVERAVEVSGGGGPGPFVAVTEDVSDAVAANTAAARAAPMFVDPLARLAAGAEAQAAAAAAVWYRVTPKNASGVCGEASEPVRVVLEGAAGGSQQRPQERGATVATGRGALGGW